MLLLTLLALAMMILEGCRMHFSMKDHVVYFINLLKYLEHYLAMLVFLRKKFSLCFFDYLCLCQHVCMLVVS